MASEEILLDLERRCEEALNHLQSRTDDEISRIQEETDVQARSIRCRQMDAARASVAVSRSHRLNRARLEAQLIRLEARNALVDAVFNAVRQELTQARQRPDYPELLIRLAHEAVAELGTPLRLAVDPRDLEMLRSHLAEAGDQVMIEATLESWGGIVACTPDGFVSVDNRLETRFRQAQSRYDGEIADLLERALNRGR